MGELVSTPGSTKIDVKCSPLCRILEVSLTHYEFRSALATKILYYNKARKSHGVRFGLNLNSSPLESSATIIV
jgi:hypothetical protein